MSISGKKDTYKYHLVLGHKVLLRSITDDLDLRQYNHQQEFPKSRVRQIGRRTTRGAALAWERQGGKRPYKKRSPVEASN